MEFTYSHKTGLTLQYALSLEWLETNGLGGYASSTGTNCNTRKYHGLLISKINNLPEKYVLLSQLEDSFVYNRIEHFLTPHQYPNYFREDIFPKMMEFTVNTNPCFYYQIDDVILSKEILMIYGENTVLIRYKIHEAIKRSNHDNFKVKIRPLLACRNFHSLTKENNYILNDVSDLKNGNGFKIMLYQSMPQLFLQCQAAGYSFYAEPLWYRNFIYEIEKNRGYDFSEDLFTPGCMTLSFDGSQEVFFVCSLEQQSDYHLERKWHREIERREDFKSSLTGNDLQMQLKKTGRSFIRKNPLDFGLSVIAGYHWFLEWGRDAMIALPGLTLFSGLEEECLAVLKEFGKHERDGLVPNFLGQTLEENAYNSVDASLWFAWAVQQYLTYTKNIIAVEKYLWVTLKNIFINYKNGTLYNIKMDETTGLIYAGSKDVNLTWMDAMINGEPVTPRYGFQVEVNALWYNMLCFMKSLGVIFDDPIHYEIDIVRERINSFFYQTFWNSDNNCLYDYVNEEGKNGAIRPNQIFAVSLFYTILTEKQAATVVETVKKHLLTPYGLRTLSPSDPKYVGKYQGNSKQRDNAYHNGTVWPWLLGHFGEALLKVEKNRAKVAEILDPCFTALNKHLREIGVGCISEIFSGDEPHTPDGCISQAWSTAEILRLSYLLRSEINKEGNE